MKFSIVIIAYKRKTYLLDALKSTLNQDYPREDFEVVVVKAFQDQTMDEYLRGLGVITVFSDTEFEGTSLADALEICSGDIICLLDDDDLFTPDKLYTMSLIYNSHPGLAVTVNSYDIIDHNGKIIESDFGLAERTLQRDLGLRIWDSNSYDLDLIIMDLNMLFNSSRISFSRSILPSVISISHDITFMVDILFVLVGVVGEKAIASLPQVLTHYRVHGDNISLIGDRKKTVEKLIMSHSRILCDTEALSRHYKKVNIKLAGYFHLWGILESLKLEMLGGSRREIAKLSLYFISEILRNYRTLSVFRSRLFNVRSIMISIAFVPLFLVSPSVARRVRLTLPF